MEIYLFINCGSLANAESVASYLKNNNVITYLNMDIIDKTIVALYGVVLFDGYQKQLSTMFDNLMIKCQVLCSYQNNELANLLAHKVDDTFQRNNEVIFNMILRQDYSFYEPLENMFNKLSKELIKTLETFVKSNMNVIKTAEALYIHRNTLYYRLDIIKRVCELNIYDYDDIDLFYTYLKTRNRIHNCA